MPANSSPSFAELARELGPLRLNYLPSYVYPHVKQEVFLRAPQKEVFFGGSAGPGKSTALLMAALQYVDVPGYAAILFRRSYADLALPGALMSKCEEWLRPTDSRWNGEIYQWTFPSTAKLAFGFLKNDDDVLKYKSAEFQFMGFDELTQFSKSQYTYMFHRVRRPHWEEGMPLLLPAADGTTLAEVPLRVRSASNPGGPGHEWVKERFVNKKTRRPGARFVEAKMQDNPSLDRESYLEMLEEMDPVERERMIEGNWDVVEAGGSFDISAFKPLFSNPSVYLGECRGWDLAVSDASRKRGDWTVGVKMKRLPNGDVLVVDVIRTKERNSGKLERLIADTAIADGRGCIVAFEQEPGAMAALYTDHLKSTIGQLAPVKSRVAPRSSATSEAGRASKIAKSKLWSSTVNKGKAVVLQRRWTMDYESEHHVFPTGSHDDQVDASALAHDMLTRIATLNLAHHIKRGIGGGDILRRQL